MNKKLNFFDYLKRTLILLGLIFMVLVVQIPVQLISLKNFTGIKLFLYIILYIVGFGIAISLATWAYRSVWRQNHIS